MRGDHDAEPEVLLLRPGGRTRLAFLVLSLALLALAVAALPYATLVGVAAVAFAGFASVNAAVRALHPRAYATRLDRDGFVAFDWRGRAVHRVAWEEVAHLTVFAGNSMRGAGAEQHLAWRCRPRRPGPGRQPWARGGRTALGEEIDGALPDRYLGIEPMLALFARRIEARANRQAAIGLQELLARLGLALRAIGEHAAADRTAALQVRAATDPDGVRKALRAGLGGMGSMNDMALDAALLRRVREAAGDLGPAPDTGVVPADPGGPIRP